MNTIRNIFWVIVGIGALIMIGFFAFIAKMDVLGDDYE